jgi:2-polyprenyl-3-methyl-5-hydroxy-6-metoxy-1,4-benzoquinol methylase
MNHPSLDPAYGEYGYATADAGWSQSYVLPALLKVLGKADRGPILDLGCGNGWLAHTLIERGYDVYGVDASSSGIEIANSRRSGRFFKMDLGRDVLPRELDDKRFATLISTEVIEHLYDPRALLRLARDILGNSPTGRLILSTPYHGYLKNVALAVSGRMDAHHTVLWDGGHIKFFSRRTLEEMLRQEGLRPLKFVGAGRLPYLWKSMVISAEVPVTSY